MMDSFGRLNATKLYLILIQSMNTFKTSILLLTLLLIASACKKNDHHDDHEEVAGFKLLRNSTIIAQQNGTVVTGNITLSLAGTNDPITVIFVDEDGHDITEMEEEVTLLIEVASSAVATVQAGPGEWQFNLAPQAAGSTTVVVNLMHGTHKDFESRNVPVTVGS